MKTLAIILTASLFTTTVFAGFSGGFRSGGFRSSSFKSSSIRNSSYKSSVLISNHIVPLIVLMTIRSNTQVSAAKLKENNIQDLQAVRKSADQAQCVKYSEDGKYIVSFNQKKGRCYVFNKLD